MEPRTVIDIICYLQRYVSKHVKDFKAKEYELHTREEHSKYMEISFKIKLK